MNLQGNLFDFIVVFIAGVGMSFNPCLYPVLPVTASVIGINAHMSRRRGFLLSMVYVSGIAAVYTALGIAAALTGAVFGLVSQHPVTKIIVGSFFIFFGLTILDVIRVKTFRIALPLASKSGGLLRIFLLGAGSGLVMSPCISPMLAAILVYVSTTRDALYGAALLMTFSYGMGLLLLLVGASGAFLAKLPKSGRWLRAVHIAAGILLLGLGGYRVITGIIGLMQR